MEEYRKLCESLHANVTAMSVALDERDGETYQHCHRVARLSMALGRAWGLSEAELRVLLISATFHDIGKIGIPDSVLKKRTPLNERDWAVMRAHSTKGERILRAAGLDESEPVGAIVRHHHEQFDGNGYPDGLAGESIPLLSRIIAIADTYDAMTTTRNYGAIRNHAEVMNVLHRGQGRQHDPAIVQRFAGLIETSPLRAA